MNYEIVTLEEKKIVGVSAKTGNQDPQMSTIIGSLWKKLYQGGVYPTIKNKKNEYAIGLYSDYTEDTYFVTVGTEVTLADNEELASKVIPAGKYAKFMLEGKMEIIVCEAWEAIWQEKLDRTFTGDFEEYLNSDMKNAKVAIYIAIK